MLDICIIPFRNMKVKWKAKKWESIFYQNVSPNHVRYSMVWSVHGGSGVLFPDVLRTYSVNKKRSCNKHSLHSNQYYAFVTSKQVKPHILYTLLLSVHMLETFCTVYYCIVKLLSGIFDFVE